MKLTSKQSDILQHRLDAMLDYAENDIADLFECPDYLACRYMDVITALSEGTPWDRCRVVFGQRYTDAVLADTVEGGTWMACVEGEHEGNRRKISAERRACMAFADIVSEFIGNTVDYPQG